MARHYHISHSEEPRCNRCYVGISIDCYICHSRESGNPETSTLDCRVKPDKDMLVL